MESWANAVVAQVVVVQVAIRVHTPHVVVVVVVLRPNPNMNEVSKEDGHHLLVFPYIIYIFINSFYRYKS